MEGALTGKRAIVLIRANPSALTERTTVAEDAKGGSVCLLLQITGHSPQTSILRFQAIVFQTELVIFRT